MPTARSLSFRLLDQHVLDGRADDPALVTSGRAWTYAQLLHDSASLAGGLRDLGVGPGAGVTLDLPDRREHVLAVLAVLRLDARFQDAADVALAGEPGQVVLVEQTLPLDVVLRAGRVDPQVAPAGPDPQGEADARLRHGDIIEVLLTGGALS